MKRMKHNERKGKRKVRRRSVRRVAFKR
jgi:hypothetical protein